MYVALHYIQQKLLSKGTYTFLIHIHLEQFWVSVLFVDTGDRDFMNLTDFKLVSTVEHQVICIIQTHAHTGKTLMHLKSTSLDPPGSVVV